MFPSLDNAIDQFEGFGQPGTIATRQNNPGDLIYGPFARSMGATGAGSNNIAVFPNSSVGFNAMDQLIQQYAGSGYNIQQLIGAWAPGNAPGNTPQSQQNYTNFVANQMGVPANTPVSALAQGQSILAHAGKSLDEINAQMLQSQTQQTGANSIATPENTKSFLPGFSFSRIAAILVGLIAIAGSIYLFKPEAINGIVEKGSALAA